MTDDVIAWLPDLLTALVVGIAMPLTWYVTWLLWRLHRDAPEVTALRVVGILSTCVALIVTTFALVFINNGMAEPPLSPRETMILTRGALLVLAVVPTLFWLRWYRSDGH